MIERIYERIAMVEARLREYVLQKVASIVQVAPSSITSLDLEIEAVEGRQSDEDSQRGLRRYQHAGFRSRASAGHDYVFLLCEGGAGKGVVVAEADDCAISLDEGEAALYSPAEPTCIITMKKDGSMSISANTAKSIDVKVSGGGEVNVDTDGTGSVNINPSHASYLGKPLARIGDMVTVSGAPWPLKAAIGGDPTGVTIGNIGTKG